MFLNSNNKINITFCGMMGSGKSVLGKKLAKKINFSFVNTDELIEKEAGKSINEIFIEKGEKYFRELEKTIISDILYKKNYVISLGGGSIVDQSIRNIIKKNSYNIYLEVNIDILTKRLSSSKNRPLILNKDIKKTLIELINQRENFYKKADLIIKNELSLNKIVETIINRIKII